MNLLESLKRHTAVVADTGDFEAIAEHKPLMSPLWVTVCRKPFDQRRRLPRSGPVRPRLVPVRREAKDLLLLLRRWFLLELPAGVLVHEEVSLPAALKGG
jgi:hypothetical protein